MKNKRITIESRGAIYAVDMDDIFYLEQEGRKIAVHVSDGIHCFYGKLAEAVKALEGNFFKCHSGCAINMDKVTHIKGQYVFFSNKEYIILGRENSLRARHSFKEYIARSF